MKISQFGIEFVTMHMSDRECINTMRYMERSLSMDYFPPSKPMNCENEHQTPERCSAGIEFAEPPRMNGGIEFVNADQHENSKSGTGEFMTNKNSRFSRKNRAAVLICIFEGLQGELRVILSKRSMKLSTHPGEVALPGGKVDGEDANDTATAVREATEEIGLDPNLVRVIGTLEPFISLHLLTVVPVVGLLPRIEEFKPMLNADEVDDVFDMPLEMFLKFGCVRLRQAGDMKDQFE